MSLTALAYPASALDCRPIPMAALEVLAYLAVG